MAIKKEREASARIEASAPGAAPKSETKLKAVSGPTSVGEEA
jgi:hypothetical protein